MSWFSAARPGTKAPGSPRAARPEEKAGGPAATHQSLGFKTLLRGLRPEASHSLLDLGPALGANVEFFNSRLACRMRIADFYRSYAGRGMAADGDDDAFRAAVRDILAFSSGETFDAVLVWDLFDYLRRPQIGALMEHVTPALRPGALLFLSLSYGKQIPAAPLTFRIVDEQTLRYGAAGEPQRPCPRYKLPDLERQMPGFAVEASFLLRNGMQEYVLVYQPSGSAPGASGGGPS